MFKFSSFLKASLATLFIVIITGFFQGTDAQTVYLEWVDNPMETIVINWIDDSGQNSTVDYRMIGEGSWTTQTGSDQSIPGPTSQYLYTVKLGGLSAGQGYEFRVGGNSEIYKFRTPPDSIDEPIKFIVGGDILDSGINLEDAKTAFTEVSEIAASYNPYFVVLGGDLANAEGKLENVDQWFFLFETWFNKMRTDDGFLIPMVAAMGNNEVDGNVGQSPDEAPFFYTFFNYPQDQWGDPVSYGNLDFNNYLSIITLDTDHTHRIPGTQTNWLNNTIKNRKNVRHIIPVYHIAGWPNFRSFRGTQEDLIRNNWHHVFRDNKLRLVFEHHDHNYKRTYPIGNCTDQIEHELNCDYGSDAADGVIYMGGGSWGSDNDRTAQNRWYLEKISQQIHNFVVVEITENYRTATAIGESNQVLDSFTDYIHLDPPTVLAPEVTSEDSFIARWEEVEGDPIYRIDISTEPDFTPIFRNYDNLSIGKNTELKLNNLEPEKTYYYRVRAQNNLTTSKNSEVVAAQLIKVDPDQSSLVVSKDMVEADDEETSTITATIIDEDGELVTNFRVSIFTTEGNLKVENNNVPTNEDGQALFKVFNDKAERVTYGANAGTVELNQKVQVAYIPVAPVALAATDVENREFTANWEMVINADTYLLDVATDSLFSNTISGYQALDVGNVTSHTVNGIDPGTKYFYRVRAVTDDLIGVNSQGIDVITFPDTPVAADATGTTVVSFMANWEMAEGAKKYRLDVARDSNFQNIVEGYEDLDVGSVLTYEVEGLIPGLNYYYRVQAQSGHRRSGKSNSINTSTLRINTEASKIEPSQLRVLANGEQTNEISVEILSENGDPQEGVPVQLIAENGSSQIDEIGPVTNARGIALFGVTDTKVEEVTYTVVAATVEVGKITLEFLQDEGILSLGNNFPNPFRINSSIPLSIPNPMHVELKVYNSLGAPVRTLLDEEMKTGYYEIPFNGADLAAGVYFYRMITEEGAKTGKMVLVK